METLQRKRFVLSSLTGRYISSWSFELPNYSTETPSVQGSVVFNSRTRRRAFDMYSNVSPFRRATVTYFTERCTFDSRLNFDEVPSGKNCRPFFGIFSVSNFTRVPLLLEKQADELLLALKRVDVRYLAPSSKKNDVPARRLNFQPDHSCHASLSCSSTYSKTRNYVLEKVPTVSISLSHRLVLQRSNYRALSEICYLSLEKLETW